MATPSIFISYRRDDSAGHAGRLLDRLVQRFGDEQVFRDIEDIAAGADFSRTLHEQVDRCDVLLALIGPNWTRVTDAQGRPRLFQAQDWVRAEIARALHRNIRVLPVLIGGARMPAAQELPPELSALATRNAVEVRDAHFDRDVEHLADVLLPRDARLRRHRWLALAALALAGVGGYAAYQASDRPVHSAQRELHEIGFAFSAEDFLRAAANGHDRAVALFLQAKIDPDVRAAPEGLDALEWAATGNHPAIARRLLQHGATSAEALGYAIARRHDAVVEAMLEFPQTPAALNSALGQAVSAGRTDLLHALLDRGADLNADRGAALVRVADADVATLDWLLAHGADLQRAVDDQGRTALERLFQTPAPPEGERAASLDLLRRLIDLGLRFDRVIPGSQIGGTPLLCAIDTQRPKAAAILLEHQAIPHVRAQGRSRWAGYTTLMAVAARNQPALVDRLLAVQVPLDARGARGESALTLAAPHHDAVMLRKLLQAGADTRATDENGYTALIVAARSHNLAGVDLLLQHGAEVDAVDGAGNTALWHAVRSNASEDTTVVRRLLVAGANAEHPNAEGTSPRRLAEQFERRSMLRLMDEAARTAASGAASPSTP